MLGKHRRPRPRCDGRRRRPIGPVVGLVVAALVLVGARPLVAQPVPGIFRQPQDVNPDGFRRSRNATNSNLQSALERAERLADDDPEQAVNVIQKILEDPEDVPYLVERTNRNRAAQDESEEIDRASLKDVAEELLVAGNGNLQETYQKLYGARAEALLETAARNESENGFREIARQFAMTQAGARAMWRLAVFGFDGGEPRTARRWCERLKRNPRDAAALEPGLSLLQAWSLRATGDESEAAAILEELRSKSPNGLTLDGRSVPWFAAGGDSGAWLEELLPQPPSREVASPAWMTAHGDRRRNGLSGTAPPILDDAWIYPLIDEFDASPYTLVEERDSRVRENIALIARTARDLETLVPKTAHPPLPTSAPLIVGDRLIFSGYGSVKSVRLSTGEFDWSTRPIDDTLIELLVETNPHIVDKREIYVRLFAGQRAYRDFVNHSISSDGRRVYRVAHGGYVGQQIPSAAGVVRQISPLGPRSFNRLQAYNVVGGKLLWDLGGPMRQLNAATATQHERNPTDLTGTFFCSAPIPWEDELLCIAEQDRQIRLLSLDPEAEGALLWADGLLNSDFDIADRPDRRFTGVLAALDGSTLVANLGHGTMIAYDVAQRRHLWTSLYLQPQPDRMPQWMMQRRQFMRPGEPTSLDSLLGVDAWLDSRVLISGSRILATPADFDRLICLDVNTGKTLWTVPRDRALFLAGVHKDTALIVKRSEVRAISITDGLTRWSVPTPAPSGRGVWNESHYTLPLSTGEVLTIDVENGRVVARSALPSNRPAGNLVAVPGLLVTQTASEIRAFRSQATLEQQLQQHLATSENDPQALAVRGEMRLHRGEIEAGEADLTRIAAVTDPRVKRTLAWSLVYGLERDFDHYYPRLSEIESLSTDPALRSQAWRNIASGLDERGDLTGAIIAAVRSVEEIDPAGDRLIDGNDSLRLREERRVQGWIDDLWRQSAEQSRAPTLQAIAEHLESLPRESQSVARALNVLPAESIPAEFELRRLEGNFFPVPEAEQRLSRLWHSDDPVIAARAGLKLLRMAIADPKASVPESIRLALAGRYAVTPLADGKSVADELASLLATPEATAKLAGSAWPDGESAVIPSTDPMGTGEYHKSLTPIGPGSELLADWTFHVDTSDSALSACDPLGVIRWRESIATRGMANSPPRISLCGRLVQLETAESLRIIDAFTGSTLKSINLYSDSLDLAQNRFLGRQLNGRVNSAQSAGPLTSRFAAFVVRPRIAIAGRSEPPTRLSLIDPGTEREFWSREVPPPAEILTDEDSVALILDNGEIRTYRAADGRQIGTTTLPAGSTPIRDFQAGIRRLVRINSDDRSEFALFDPVRKDFVWRIRSSPKARHDVVNGTDLAIAEPDGQFTLYNGATGQQRWTVALNPEPDLAGPVCVVDARRLYVCMNRLITPAQHFANPVDLSEQSRMVDGRFFALDRETGERLWTHTVERLTIDPRQPGGWPFLILVGHRPARADSDVSDGPARRVDREMAIQILRRSDGQVLYEALLPNSRSFPRGWKADPSSGTLIYRLGDAGVQLSPKAAKPVEKPEPEKEGAPEQKTEPGAAPPPPESKTVR